MTFKAVKSESRIASISLYTILGTKKFVNLDTTLAQRGQKNLVDLVISHRLSGKGQNYWVLAELKQCMMAYFAAM